MIPHQFMELQNEPAGIEYIIESSFIWSYTHAEAKLLAGTNNLDDVDLYIFEASKAADPGFLNRTAVNSSDEVLKSLLRADMQAESWIAGWENHIENLPEDPTQVSHACMLFSCSWQPRFGACRAS